MCEHKANTYQLILIELSDIGNPTLKLPRSKTENATIDMMVTNIMYLLFIIY